MLKKEDFPYKVVDWKLMDEVAKSMFRGTEDEVRLRDLAVSALETCLKHRDCCNAFTVEPDERPDCTRTLYIEWHHGREYGLTAEEESTACEKLWKIREELKAKGKLSEFYEAVEE